MSKLSLKTFLYNQRAKKLTTSTLVCYTIPLNSSSRKTCLTDPIYRIKDPLARADALRWRRNKIAFTERVHSKAKKITGSKCTKCSMKWHRNHVSTCPVVLQSQHITDAQWQREQETILDRFPRAKHSKIVDSLLNNNSSALSRVIKDIEANLEKASIPITTSICIPDQDQIDF